MDFNALFDPFGTLGKEKQPASPLEALLKGGPMQGQNLPPGTISEAGAMPGYTPRQPSYNDAPANDDGAVMVTGDGWKPDKRSTLGTVLDMLFGLGGGPAVFANRIKAKNVNRAMEGFHQDPVQAIRRLSQIRGMEGEAWKMYGQHRDDSRADEVAKMRRQESQDKARGVIGSMAGAARPDNWSKVAPIMRKYAEARGLDPTEIPDEYSEEFINTYRYGALPVDDQQDNARDQYWKENRLQDFDEQEAGRNARHQNNEAGELLKLDIVEANKDRRQVYDNDRADQRKRIAPGKNPEGATAMGVSMGVTGSGKFLEKNGERVGELTPDGKYMMLYSGPDKVRIYDAKTKQFLREKEVPKK